MHYDSIYRDNPNSYGQKPNVLLTKIVKKITGKEFLDLGCGQGRDSFYMARKKFNVTEVDNSKVAVSQIKKALREKKINNIQAICQDISKFLIKPGRFSVINCQNALQFLSKKNNLKVIKNIQKNILSGGFIIITSFTSKNPPSKRRKSHFEPGELKKLFEIPDFKIIHYFEGIFVDNGHIGQPKPHKHGVVRIIAQKK